MKLGPYTLTRELARGGMGIVYLGRHEALARDVVVKFVLAGPKAGPTVRARFQREAQALARLRHPNIVPIHDYGESPQGPYLVLDHVPGPSLEELLERDGPFQPARALEIVRKVALAIEAAHQAGILHRDLKPTNVLLDPSGEPQVIDFGLARSLSPASSLTGEGVALGTLGYTAPEVLLASGPPTAASDVYSLGATLYALLTGRTPLGADTLAEIMEGARRDLVRPPSEWRPGVGRPLDRVVLRCLHADPSRRWPSAGALAQALGRLPAPGRARLAAFLSLALALTGLVTAALLLLTRRAPVDPSDAPRAATPAPAASAAKPSPTAGHVGQLVPRRIGPLPPGEADRAMSEGRFEAARELLERSLQEAPGDPMLWSNLGVARAALGDRAGARVAFERALALDPRCLGALVSRASLLGQLGDLQGALRDLDLAHETDPADPAILRARAQARHRAGDLEGALADTERVVALDPSPQHRVERAALMTVREPASALAELEAVLAELPGHQQARYCRGLALSRLGRYPEAMAEVSRLLEDDPEDPNYLQARGQMRRLLEDHAGAIEDLERAIPRLDDPAARAVAQETLDASRAALRR